MAKASRVVLNGFELRTNVDIVEYHDRYHDDRGTMMWQQVMRLVDAREKALSRFEVA